MATNDPRQNGTVEISELDPQPVQYGATVSRAEQIYNTTMAAASEAETVNPAEIEATATQDAFESAPATDTANGTNSAITTNTTPPEKRWSGWPGHCVFRLIVPVIKVGSIIGRKGELIKKICEETRARIRVLDGATGTTDRIVLVFGREEPEAPLSPAMDAVLKVFKRISGLSEVVGDDKASGPAGVAFCSIRLLAASTQAINLIGKQGSSIKSIQENTGASVRVLSGDEVPFYAADDERIVEIQGEAFKVLKALEAVVGHLRKFLVDHSVLPLFEKTYNEKISQDRTAESWPEKSSMHTPTQTNLVSDFPLPTKRESLFLEHETQLDSHLPSSRLSLFGQETSFSSLRSSGLSRPSAPIVTQVTQTMQIPLSYAEDIIGVRGSNIAYIRRTSGAILTIQESGGLRDEITVEIQGTSSQVQMAQQLIQEAMGHHNKEPATSSYGRLDTGLRSSYSQLGGTSYSSSSLSSQPYTGYGSSGLGGYSTFRL